MLQASGAALGFRGLHHDSDVVVAATTARSLGRRRGRDRGRSTGLEAAREQHSADEAENDNGRDDDDEVARLLTGPDAKQ